VRPVLRRIKVGCTLTPDCVFQRISNKLSKKIETSFFEGIDENHTSHVVNIDSEYLLYDENSENERKGCARLFFQGEKN